MERTDDKRDSKKGRLTGSPDRFTIRNEPEMKRLQELLDSGQIDRYRFTQYMKEMEDDRDGSSD